MKKSKKSLKRSVLLKVWYIWKRKYKDDIRTMDKWSHLLKRIWAWYKRIIVEKYVNNFKVIGETKDYIQVIGEFFNKELNKMIYLKWNIQSITMNKANKPPEWFYNMVNEST